MSLRVRGTRQLFTAPKGEKGEKGDDGNSFTPKGQADGHFESSDEFDAAFDDGQLNYGERYLVDDAEGGTAKVYSIAIRRIGIVSANDADAYTIVSTKHVWVATGNVWTDFGDIQGPQGEQGNDAELYRLQLTEGWARWEPYENAWRLKCCIKGNAWWIRGKTKVSASSGGDFEQQRIRIRYDNGKQLHFADIADDGSWSDGMSGNYLEDDEYGTNSTGQPKSIIVELIGKDINDLTQVLDSQSIAIAWDGRKGDTGAPGPMGYPAGKYNDTARYERTDSIMPIVEHNGEYWYPREKGVLTNSEPSAGNNAWKKAENFEVMFVKVLFAAFATLGSFVVVGDYFISQYGTLLYNSNGTTARTLIDRNNYDSLINGKVPYTYFDGVTDDPATGQYRFIPALIMDALKGNILIGGKNIGLQGDGSGWLASENIQWDAAGHITYKGLIATPYKEIESEEQSIRKGGCIAFRTEEAATDGFRLPVSLGYDGCEIDIINLTSVQNCDISAANECLYCGNLPVVTIKLRQRFSRCRLKAVKLSESDYHIRWVVMNKSDFELLRYNPTGNYYARSNYITWTDTDYIGDL